MSRILVVEDEPVIRHELKRILAREGHTVVDVGDVPAARDKDPTSFDLVVTDLRLPGPSGDTLIEEATGVPVIVLTAHGTVSSAVDAMRRGAHDYVSKPVDPDELALIVRRALAARRSSGAQARVPRTSEHGIVGSSAPIRKVIAHVDKVAPTRATVLVLGESGTGKELVARAIHDRSDRSDAAFVPVNCASIPDTLIESELFGHERGAFTGASQARSGLVESANGGTLFLDEIGELPVAAQARLLRMLQESEIRRVGANRARSVDVRIVAATHCDLPAMVARGTFRQDLYFRLKVFEVRLPPLRKRGEDVIEIAEALLDRVIERRGMEPLRLAPTAKDAIRQHAWPGNVRELENAVERAVILHEKGPITPDLLGLEAVSALTGSPTRSSASSELSLEDYFVNFVRENEAKMSETELARALGISRKTLWQRRKKLGIPRK